MWAGCFSLCLGRSFSQRASFLVCCWLHRKRVYQWNLMVTESHRWGIVAHIGAFIGMYGDAVRLPLALYCLFTLYVHSFSMHLFLFIWCLFNPSKTSAWSLWFQHFLMVRLARRVRVRIGWSLLLLGASIFVSLRCSVLFIAWSAVLVHEALAFVLIHLIFHVLHV